MRHNLPTIEINFPFEVDNLVLILSITGFQNANDLGLPPIFAMRTLSNIPLPLRKAIWWLSITFDRTLFNLLARIFEITLYTYPTKEIGLY